MFSWRPGTRVNEFLFHGEITCAFRKEITHPITAKRPELTHIAMGSERVSIYTTSPCLSFLSGDACLGTGGVLSLYRPASLHSICISASGTWVKDGNEDLLFLHPDYREKLRFVIGNAMVFADGSSLQFCLTRDR